MDRNVNDEKTKSGMLSGLIGGTLSLTASAVIVKLIGLFYKIPIASFLGDEGMGYFNSAYTVYAFFYLLCTAGVPKAVMILISEAKARGKECDQKKIFRIAIILFLSVGTFLTLLFMIFAHPISHLIGNSGSYLTMVAIAPSIIFVALSGVIRGYLSANTRLLDIAVSQVVEGVGKLGVGLILAGLGKRWNLDLKCISALTILGVTFGSVVGLLYLLVCLKTFKPNEKAGQNDNSIKASTVIKRILSISLPITLSAALMSVSSLIDLGLIMRSLVKIGYNESVAGALYGNYTTLAVPMLNLAMSVISPISIAFLPILTRCIVSSDKEGFKRTEKSAIGFSQILAAPMMIGLIVYAREILTMLFKKSEIEIGARLLSFIAPSIFFYSLLLIINTILEAAGRTRAPLLSMAIGSIVKVGVSYYLIVKAEMGIIGAPVGTVISYAVALVISTLIYGISFKKHAPIFEGSVLPYLSSFIAIILSRFVYDRIILILSPTPALMLSILIAALIYLIILAFCGIIRPKEMQELAKYTNLS